MKIKGLLNHLTSMAAFWRTDFLVTPFGYNAGRPPRTTDPMDAKIIQVCTGNGYTNAKMSDLRGEHMTGTPLMIGAAEREALALLRGLAAEHPVDMTTLTARLKTFDGKQAHMNQMTRQSVAIPLDFLVTFSIETGHPVGTCRHMSMSVGKVGRIPNAHALWMIADLLGFTDNLDACTVWREELQGHGVAINVVQPITAEGSHA